MSLDRGRGCEIHPTAIIHNDVWIGDDVYIGPHAIIGAPPQHRGSYPSPLDGHKYDNGVSIASGTVVREFTTIHAGIIQHTHIGQDTMLMAYTHVGHDTHIGDGVTIATGSFLGGFTMIDDHATLGQGVVTHPWVIIGEHSMVGLNTSVVRDVMPYQKVAGSPARLIGANTHQAPHLTEWNEDALDHITTARWSDLTKSRDTLRYKWRDTLTTMWSA